MSPKVFHLLLSLPQLRRPQRLSLTAVSAPRPVLASPLHLPLRLLLPSWLLRRHLRTQSRLTAPCRGPRAPPLRRLPRSRFRCGHVRLPEAGADAGALQAAAERAGGDAKQREERASLAEPSAGVTKAPPSLLQGAVSLTCVAEKFVNFCESSIT